MIEVLTTDSQKLLHQLTTLLEQESRCQPKVCGLKLIESAHDNGLRMTARLRDFEVKDLLSLTQFFGFDTETFSLAVNLLDRFLSKMKVCSSYTIPFLNFAQHLFKRSNCRGLEMAKGLEVLAGLPEDLSSIASTQEGSWDLMLSSGFLRHLPKCSKHHTYTHGHTKSILIRKDGLDLVLKTIFKCSNDSFL